ncbi:uncharacterized protein LOC134225871 [Armigeres subalbatus]|uniref:uncharacterized protein LOC134225871 n=1 Tax=Armigeres subalbatus TaxID=124917 RepID=UPI002ED3A4C5
MPFIVVQTRKSKKSRPVLTVVPSKWVSGDVVYWPPTNFVTLSVNGDSEPVKELWQKQKCKVMGRENTLKSAEEIVRKLENVTDSEDAAQTTIGTRAHPGKKKQVFQSKTYQLAALNIEPSNALQLSQSEAFRNTTDSEQHIEQPSCSYRSPVIFHPPGNNVHNPNLSLPTSGIRIQTGIAHPPQVFSSIVGTSVEPVNAIVFDQKNQDDGKSLQVEKRTSDEITIISQQGYPQGMAVMQGNARTNIEQLDCSSEQHISISEPLQMIQASNGKQYIKLQDGSYLEVSEDQMNDETVPINTKINDVEDTKDGRCEVLKSIDERLTRIESCLQKITLFMADVSKFMEIRKDTHESISSSKMKMENFQEVEMLFPIDDDGKLKSMEMSLCNPSFSEKISRYFSIQYDLNGKRDGKAMFKILIRKMITPAVLLPYSWMGNSKKNRQNQEPNKGFKTSFPNIVIFFEKILREADIAFTNEAVHKAFGDHLRQKYTEMNRFLSGGERRMPSSRVRIRKPKIELKEMDNHENKSHSENENSSSSSTSLNEDSSWNNVL